MTVTRTAEPRRRWRGIAQAVAVIAIVVGAGVAIYAERTTMHNGIDMLSGIRLKWLIVGITAEFASMVAFAFLEKRLLQAGGVPGSALSLKSVLATAYGANAIAIAVPIVGSAMAASYAYREFRRRGAEPHQVSVALAIAGAFSTVTFALLAAVGAIVTGNLAAAALAAAGGVIAVILTGCLLASTRFPRPRAWLERLSVAALRACRRVIRRPRQDPADLVGRSLERVASVRLGYRVGWEAFGWALANWTADVACLVCAIAAIRAPVPWRAILIVWSAGAGAASLCPVPGGLGVVDVVLITALTAAGLTAPHAVAAVLLYRIITFKIFFTLGWLGYHRLRERRQSARSARDGLP